MATTFDSWLRQLAAAGKGPVTLYAHRNTAFDSSITLTGDFTGSSLRGQVRAMPDSATSLAAFTVTGPTVSEGTTTFTLSIAQATLAALPADSDADGEEALAFDLLMTPSGGTEELLLGGTFMLLGGITA